MEGSIVTSETVPRGFVVSTGSFPKSEFVSQAKGRNYTLDLGVKPAEEGFHRPQDSLLVTSNIINGEEVTVIGVADGVSNSFPSVPYAFSGENSKMFLSGFNRIIHERFISRQSITESTWLNKQIDDLRDSIWSKMGNTTLQFYVVRRKPNGAKTVTSFMIGNENDLGVNQLSINSIFAPGRDFRSNSDRLSFALADNVYPIVTEYPLEPNQTVTIATSTDGIGDKDGLLTSKSLPQILREATRDDLVCAVLTVS